MTSYNLDALREDDVQAFVDAGLHEGHRLDYKSVEIPEDLEETVAAMANTEGGLIVLGVEEKQCVAQRVVGMRAGRADMKLRLQQRILANVSPRPTFRIGTAPMRDDSTRLVGIIEVVQGDHPPYAYQQSHFRVRRGPKNDPATILDIEHMIARRGDQRRRANEAFSSFQDQPVNPSGGMAGDDMRRYLRVQLDAAPVSPSDIVIDRPIEQDMLTLIEKAFRWTDSCPRIVDRDVDSVEFAVDNDVLGTRRWKVHADGHLCFASPIVHGVLRDGADQVFLTDVAVDLMRALAWVARGARRLGASGNMAVSGTLWAHGCALENDSRTRVHRCDGRPVALAGIALGTPRSVNPRMCNQVVSLAVLETATGSADVAAEILRTALRSQRSAEIDLASLAEDLAAREADSFSA